MICPACKGFGHRPGTQADCRRCGGRGNIDSTLPSTPVVESLSVSSSRRNDGVRRVAPCCDDPPHQGSCDAVSHRYRATRAATVAEIRVAGERGQGGLVQLVKRSMEADVDLEVRA